MILGPRPALAVVMKEFVRGRIEQGNDKRERVLELLVKYLEPGVWSFCRVDWGLPMLQVDVCFLSCHLVSQWCHNISAIHQLYPSPSQNRTSGFPASGSSLKHSASGETGSCALSPSHLSVFDLCSQCAHALNRVCVSSCTDVRAREPSLHGD